MKYAWIASQADRYPVRWMCELLGVSASGYYAARERKPSVRAYGDAELSGRIRAVQERHRGCYGRRRMNWALRAQGHKINEKRVGRLMRQGGMQSQLRRRFRVVTTDSKHAHPVAPNVLNREFNAEQPNEKWVGDITYVPTAEGWLFVALIVDLFSRKIVGWALSPQMPQQLTLAALIMALGLRNPPAGLLHHSDRGSQYAALAYQEVLSARGITVSMSRRANCWDNAAMESVNGTLKVECVHRQRFQTHAQAEQALIEYNRLLQHRAATLWARLS